MKVQNVQGMTNPMADKARGRQEDNGQSFMDLLDAQLSRPEKKESFAADRKKESPAAETPKENAADAESKAGETADPAAKKAEPDQTEASLEQERKPEQVQRTEAAEVLAADLGNLLQELAPVMGQAEPLCETAAAEMQPDGGAAAVQVSAREQLLPETGVMQQEEAVGAPVYGQTEAAKPAVPVERKEDVRVSGTENRQPQKQPAAAAIQAEGQKAEEDPVSYGNMLKDQAAYFKGAAERSGSPKPEGTAPADGETADTESLQKKVDQKEYLPFDRMVAARMGGRPQVTAAQEEIPGAGGPVMQQLQTGLKEGMNRGLQHFTIRLKPEGLGEIVVRMASEGGRITMRIGVSNEETQKLINTEMASLKETLQPLHAEVQEVYHSSTGGMDLSGYQQEMYRQQQQMTGKSIRHGGAFMPEDESLEDTVRTVYAQSAGGLYAYI